MTLSELHYHVTSLPSDTRGENRHKTVKTGDAVDNYEKRIGVRKLNCKLVMGKNHTYSSNPSKKLEIMVILEEEVEV